DSGECRYASLLKVFRKAGHLERWVNLKKKRLVPPVQRVRMHPEAHVRVLGSVVVFPGRVDVAVGHEGGIGDGRASNFSMGHVRRSILSVDKDARQPAGRRRYI